MPVARLPFVCALLFLAPTFLSAVDASTWVGDNHHLNVNQPLVLPGRPVTLSLSGSAGDVTLYVGRVTDPAAVRSFNSREGLGPLETVDAREWPIRDQGNGWGQGTATYNFTKPGLYFVETRRGEATQRAFLQVTTASFLVKEGPAQAMLFAFHLEDGHPLAGARVLVNGTAVGSTGADGTFALDANREPGPLFVIGPDGAPGAGDLSHRGWWTGDSTRILTYFDRPIYRPGQTVHFKSIVLARSGDRLLPADVEGVRVKVTTYSRGVPDVVYDEALSPNAYGSVAGSFRLADDAALGSYSVEVSTPAGAQGWASFDVEAYKKPRVKVEVDSQRDAYVHGEPIVLRAQATWFFGAPLARGIVKYEIEEQPVWDPWGGCRFCTRSMAMAPGIWPGPHGGGGIVAEGRGALGADGSFSFTFEPKSPGDGSAWYVARVFVTAESGEEQSGTATFVLHPSAFALDLSTDAYAYGPGKPVAATATVKDHSGAPVEGAVVEVRLVEERGDGGTLLRATTDANGRASVTFPAPSGGSHRVEALVKDAEGRPAKAQRWLWIASEGLHGGYDPGSEITLIPERETYSPGETARVLVLVTKPSTVLLAVEGADLFDWRVVHVEGSRFVDLPLAPAYAPGVAITATTVRGIAEGAYHPDYRQAEVQLDVLPDPRELSIRILTEKPAYRDGDRARLLVEVRDAEGRPVVAEVALSVVDEAIHALRPDHAPRLLDQVYPLARNVQTTFAWYTVGGPRYTHFSTDGRADFLADGAVAAMAPPSAGDARSVKFLAPESAPSVEVKVRESFPDTALWLPFLTTDATGTARVELTAPDTLTEWRVTGRAHDAKGLVGEAKSAFHTRKPLMVEIAAPRFFVQGDELRLTALVWNYVGEMRDVELQLVGKGAVELLDSGYRTVTLSDGDSVRVDFPIRIPQGSGPIANLTLLAYAGGATEETDGHRLNLPVLPHGVLERVVRAGTDAADLSLPVPKGPFAANPTLTLTLSPTMAGTVLDALPYLLGFPYGCVEQTMSRFMPDVVATKALKDAGYEGIDDPKLPEYVEAGLERLYRFQHSDGGWGWWEQDETHPYMTAYVVAGLVEAKRAGTDVDADRLARGAEALAALYAKEEKGDLRAYMAYALALAGTPPGKWPAEDSLGPDGLALLGLAKLAVGDRDGAAILAEKLLGAAIRDGGRLRWAGDAAHWGLHSIRSDVQLTAHAMRLLVGLGRADEAASIVPWLAERRQGSAWETTKDTTESILAIVEYLTETDELRPDFEAVVTIGGETRRVTFRGDAKDLKAERIEIPVPVSLAGSTLPLAVVKAGSGRLYWTAFLSSVPHADEIAPAASGVEVRKRILDASGNDARVLAFDEEYTVQLNVTARSEGSYVLLKDALPAGVEVVRESWASSVGDGPGIMEIRCFRCWPGGGWGWPWSNVEIRDDHVAAFATNLPKGDTAFTYRIRAVNPGSYHVLPARVEAMYDPTYWGRSGELHVEISEPPRLLLGTAKINAGEVRVRLYAQGEKPLSPADVTARLLDETGNEIDLAAPVEVIPLDDGSLDVALPVDEELPAIVTVEVKVNEIVTLRRLDSRGEPARFDGAFPAKDQAAWDAGVPVDATTVKAQGTSGKVDPKLFQRAEPRPRPMPEPEPEPQPPTHAPDPGTRLPAPGWLAAGVAVAVAAMVLSKRRRS